MINTIQNFDLPPNGDALGFFEGVALNGLEGKPVRFGAALQRQHFGGVPFGKKQTTVREDGTVVLFVKKAFGQDWDNAVIRYAADRRCWVYASDYSEAGALGETINL